MSYVDKGSEQLIVSRLREIVPEAGFITEEGTTRDDASPITQHPSPNTQHPMISFHNDILPLKNELYRLALRITLNPAEAEDVVQETMMKVWNRRDEWERIESIEAFCLTICRNLSLDKLRRMDNHVQSLDSTIDPSDNRVAFNPEEHAVQRDRVHLVRRLIDQLPEKQRSVMQLRDIEGKSYRDIATILNISEEQVKINIFRARRTIKERFREAEQYGV